MQILPLKAVLLNKQPPIGSGKSFVLFVLTTHVTLFTSCFCQSYKRYNV